MAPNGSRGGERGCRRGSAYVLFMATSLLVTIIGLTALTLSRLETRAAAATNDAALARTYALSGVEHAILRVYLDPGWRSTFQHGAWEPAQPIGRGSFEWKLADETNLALDADDDAPVRVYGKGTCGDSIRVYSVLLSPPPTPAFVSDPDLISNGHFDASPSPWWPGSECQLTSETKPALNGSPVLEVKSRTTPNSGPRYSLGAVLESGATYRFDAWARVKTYGDNLLCGIWVDYSDGTGEYIALTHRALGANTWTRVTGTVTPVWSKTVADATLQITTTDRIEKIWVDDVSLRRIPGVSIGPIPGTWRREQQ